MAKELAIGVALGQRDFRNGPDAVFREIARMGIPTVHMPFLESLDHKEGLAEIKTAAERNSVEITTVFCGFSGESYADIPTIRATVGLVPSETQAARLETVRRIARFAANLGVRRVAAHIGYVPEDRSDARYTAIVAALKGVCDHLQPSDQVFALETGQETAGTLHRLIMEVEKKNLRVNFDPANMILYGNDDPIEATPLLADWIDGVHCKDGVRPEEHNRLGEETRLGEGAVNIAAWIRQLLETGYRGPLTIERETHGEEQRRDIRQAKQLLEGCVREYTSKAW